MFNSYELNKRKSHFYHKCFSSQFKGGRDWLVGQVCLGKQALTLSPACVFNSSLSCLPKIPSQRGLQGLVFHRFTKDCHSGTFLHFN